MNKIDDIISNLNLISYVVPSYSEGRGRGLSDEETENLANKAVNQAIELLEKEKHEITKAYNEGYNDGYRKGEENGYKEGIEEGYNAGISHLR